MYVFPSKHRWVTRRGLVLKYFKQSYLPTTSFQKIVQKRYSLLKGLTTSNYNGSFLNIERIYFFLCFMHASYTVKLVINIVVYKTKQTLLAPCMVVNRLPDKGYRGLLLRYVFSEVVTDTKNFYEVTSTCCLFLKCRLQTDCLKSIRRFPLIS